MTTVVSKQLLPVFDKPMIYYPLSTLMLAGIRDILIISTPQDGRCSSACSATAREIGLRFSYADAGHPRGLADAFIVGREFVGAGSGRADPRRQHLLRPRPARAAVERGRAQEGRDGVRLCRQHPGAIWRGRTRRQRPRALDRGKAEAAEIERRRDRPLFLRQRRGRHRRERSSRRRAANSRSPTSTAPISSAATCIVEVLGRGFAWLDTGTHASLVEASHFVQILEQRQGLRIACPEEIALRHGYISLEHFERLAQTNAKSSYGEYLMSVTTFVPNVDRSSREAIDMRFEGIDHLRHRRRRLHRLRRRAASACAIPHARVVNIDKLTYAANLASIPQARRQSALRLREGRHLRRRRRCARCSSTTSPTP